MKYGVVKLFLFRNTNSVLMELQHLFEKHLVPIRPREESFHEQGKEGPIVKTIL